MTKKKVVSKKSPAKNKKALANYDEELAQLAEQAADQEAHTGGGKAFKVAQGGILEFDGGAIPRNTMAVVIVDSVLENKYYTSDFVDGEPTGVACFALGRAEPNLMPHESVKAPQSPNCDECKLNEWGSADKGKGKACGNRRRLALIPAGELDKHGDFSKITDVEHFRKEECGYFSIPPTAIKAYAAYVKKLKSALKRPPFAVYTQITVEPGGKNQFSINFELLGPVDNKLIPTLIERNKAEAGLIMWPHNTEEAAAPPKKKSAKGGKKKAKSSGRARPKSKPRARR